MRNRKVHQRQDRRRSHGKDEGSSLVIVLAFILIGALFLVPMMQYAVSVTRSSNAQRAKLQRSEAVKGAFRTAMADAKDVYDACSGSGLNVPVTLANPNLSVGVTTECYTVKSALEVDPTELRVAMTTTLVTSAPPVGTVGSVYPGSGSGTTNAWVNDTTSVSQGGKILLPRLPAHALTHPSSAGYLMPAWVGNCRVFFPGTYNDPITITSSQPVFFTSGVYYFDNVITISGNANVVVGGGSVEGCTNDQEAAFNAIGAPTNHNITGYGATWVFGGAGRLVMDNSVAGTPSLQFNTRLVADTDVASQSSRSVSIMSVNGVVSGSAAVPLDVPAQIYVPNSTNNATPPVQAMVDGYVPSTLRPDGTATPYNPIIDINFTAASAATLWIPGYVAVPQGYIRISVAPGMSAGKSVQMVGGVLASHFNQTPDQPATLQLGIVNRVVQKTFKIVSRTSAGSPRVVSTAVVQINDYGEYVVNSWEISVE